jgi:type II secretory pathway pseudopilin PulG
MRLRFKQTGLTLTEMTVVVASIVLLAVIGLPAVRAFIHSFETESSTKSMIGAALASARAMTAQNQKYAGIRFQQDTGGHQYMIFIVWEEPKKMGGLTVGFRAVEGLKPIKLPDTIGVMDLKIVTNRDDSSSYKEIQLDDPMLPAAVADGWINESRELTDTTTFSIIFSPSGKLVIHRVQVRNKNGEGDYPSYPSLSNDDIFNKKAKVDLGIGMFYQDDYFGDNAYPDLGLGPELSRNSFIIYDRKEFTQAYKKGQAYSGCLYSLVPEAIYINPYTGTIISK